MTSRRGALRPLCQRKEVRKEGRKYEHASLVSTFPVVGIGNVGTVFRNEMRPPEFRPRRRLFYVLAQIFRACGPYSKWAQSGSQNWWPAGFSVGLDSRLLALFLRIF